MDLRNGGFGHDTLLIQQSDDLSQLWVRTGRSLAADWTIAAYPIGGGGGGGSTAGEILAVVVANVSAWAIHGNASSIPYGKMPFVLPSYILDPLNHPDIPYSALDGTIESWAVKDASPPLEIIPNERLPVARFLPSAGLRWPMVWLPLLQAAHGPLRRRLADHPPRLNNGASTSFAVKIPPTP